MPTEVTLQQRVRELLEGAGHNVKQAAKLTTVPYATMYDIWAGRVENPERENLRKIASAYGVTVDYLIGANGAADLQRGAKLLAARLLRQLSDDLVKEATSDAAEEEARTKKEEAAAAQATAARQHQQRGAKHTASGKGK